MESEENINVLRFLHQKAQDKQTVVEHQTVWEKAIGPNYVDRLQRFFSGAYVSIIKLYDDESRVDIGGANAISSMRWTERSVSPEVAPAALEHLFEGLEEEALEVTLTPFVRRDSQGSPEV